MKPKFKIKLLVAILTMLVTMMLSFVTAIAINFEQDVAFAVSFTLSVLNGVNSWYYVDRTIKLHTKNRKSMWAMKANGNKLRREICTYCKEDDYCEIEFEGKPFCSKQCVQSYKSEA